MLAVLAGVCCQDLTEADGVRGLRSTLCDAPDRAGWWSIHPPLPTLCAPDHLVRCVVASRGPLCLHPVYCASPEGSAVRRAWVRIWRAAGGLCCPDDGSGWA